MLSGSLLGEWVSKSVSVLALNIFAHGHRSYVLVKPFGWMDQVPLQAPLVWVHARKPGRTC